MKLTISLLFICFLFSVQAQMKNLYVAYSTGINMRESAALNANLLIKIPYGTKLNLDFYTRAGKEEIVENMTGKWVEVTYQGKKGYVLDCYLTLWPPPKKGTKTFDDYLSQITKKYGPALVYNNLVSNQPIEESNKQSKQLYTNGVAKHHLAATEYFSDSYYLPFLSMQETFLLLRQIAEFKNYFTEKDAYFVANTKLKRKLEKEEIEIDIKVEKDNINTGNEINKMILEYEQGAFYHFEMFMFEGHVVININSGV